MQLFLPFRRAWSATCLVAGGAVAALLALSPPPLRAQSITITGPTGSGLFGSTVTVLLNGNFVVTDPGYDNGGTLDVGAVYLYNGSTKAIISTLVGGAASDQVGNGGIAVLTNGNFVVLSPAWHNGAVAFAGAATWGSATSGVSGVVSAANSLVGSSANDYVGSSSSVTALPNGNYVVGNYNWDNGAATDTGAVTWGNGTTGVSGVVSAANSLVGSNSYDRVGDYGTGIKVLANGNYLVCTPFWKNGTTANAGAVTWADGAVGVRGTISAANSLVGTTANDQVGTYGTTVLTNGNYVLANPFWSNGATTNVGAVTWGSGTTGVTGVISAANSLVGTTTNDQVGSSGIIRLSNGHYVVPSPNWDNGATANVGATTWANGTTGRVGSVTTANSLVGTTADDRVGASITALTNGHYVVRSYFWDNGAVVDAGAVTWADGTTGRAGPVTASNSLVGITANDRVGSSSVTTLPNGNYVVVSPNWDNGPATDAGAVTWGSGTTGVSGVVSTANSLVGTTANDQVGGYLIYLLSNGNYLVRSPNWSNGPAANAGAVTWGDATAGVSGVVSTTNSLVGSAANDQLGSMGITLLPGGAYVVASPNWNNGAATDAGAATWGSGTTGVSGAVSAANSLVGTTANDQVGNRGVTALTNGHYVVGSYSWDNGPATDAGAVTWGSGTTGVSGAVSAANSLVGITANDRVGSGQVFPLATGAYTVGTTTWHNGAMVSVAALTLGSATGGTTGPITACNSIIGNAANQNSLPYSAYNAATGELLGGLPGDNKVVILTGPPPAPAGAASQHQASGATVANLQATGTAIQWYAGASGGTPLPGTTPLTGGTTYYASQTVGGCESTARLAVLVPAPLPVELLAFTATAVGPAAVRLAWATATEQNSAAFEVERSLDGHTFERVGTLAAAGSSGTPRSYHFVDSQVPRTPSAESPVYYRLRQVDLDGTFRYSPVRTVALTGAADGLSLYPNPAHSAATLAGAQPGTVVTVFDALGRPVATATADAAGTAALALPAGAPAGVYVVRAGVRALRLTAE